ncbi:NmrA family NAD(P)-binding protein [Mesorhizobium sp.]|uniref:NmrA family NAD(P)-binding protein n=1 Tax=Mesorhizobium sp. TaxID=1871066 RepID=UPI000FEA746D|nr:NmrA family NAD(P)-binding protein [Mesorhizobium sp.]RWN29854.1 MAG: NAD-dependent epimerase/dehydratase family protein [Mesorhizobium sp.]
MHIILGGTGHVGSAAAMSLLQQGEAVTIVTRDPSKGAYWTQRGAEIAVADVHDSEVLRHVFRQGERLFLLNPSADPSTDTDVEERKTVAAITAALEGSGLRKIVAQSTYGAQPGDRCGDLNILYGLEQKLRTQPIPASIIRAAYYMSNWDSALETAEQDGVVNTFFPADFRLPMVAPDDLGRAAARLLKEPIEQTGTHYVEGPARYTASDVAAGLSDELRKDIQVVPAPREKWQETFEGMGFSRAAAESYARMTALTLDELELPADPERGTVTLQRYISDLVARRN